jgi:hypothetical protein
MTSDERHRFRAYRNKLAKVMLLADVMRVDMYELLAKLRRARNENERRDNTQETNGKAH